MTTSRQPPERPTDDATAPVVQVATELLVDDPLNPRRHMPEERVERLAASIEADGLDEALKVRPLPDGTYGVLSGKTRHAALTRLGWSQVPVSIIEGLTDRQAAYLAVRHNTARGNLTVAEEAAHYRLLADDGATQTEIADNAGVAQSRVSNVLKYLELDEDIQQDIDDGNVSLTRAIDRNRRRYKAAQGVPRGEAAARAREQGPVAAAHLTREKAASTLGLSLRELDMLISNGSIKVDDVSGGVPLHSIKSHLDKERQAVRAVANRSKPERDAMPGYQWVQVRTRDWQILEDAARDRNIDVHELLAQIADTARGRTTARKPQYRRTG